MSFARKALIGLCMVSGFLATQSTALQPAQVESFNPQGDVKGVRQVTARFSEPMVAFGDPRLESPFDIQCAGTGSGHWADTRNWLYDFKADLPAGEICNFKLRDNLTTASGGPVTAANYRFSTGGPAIRNSWPEEGDESIDEQQVFLLGLDASADLASVREHARCDVTGLGERIPLEIIEGEQREKILAEQQGRASNFFAVINKRGKLGVLAVKDNRLKTAPIVVARCARTLPPGVQVNLVWGKGIRSVSAVATTEDQTLPFKVRVSFLAKTTCERVNAQAGCVPVLPLHLLLTAPIAKEFAEKIIVRGADGKVMHALLDERAQTFDELTFSGPFLPRSQVTIEVPPGMVDDAGRPLVNGASFPLKVRIDDDPPLIKFPSHFGILETNAQPVLPVSVRNVEATLKGLQVQVAGGIKNETGQGSLARINANSDEVIARWLRLVMNGPPRNRPENSELVESHYPREGELPLLYEVPNAKGESKTKSSAEFSATTLSLPRPDGERPFELMGIPLPKPGFYVVEFASNRLGAALHNENKPYYAYSSALVTNLAVHLKKGREASLIWVTRLDNAKPVAGAKLSVSTCMGKPVWQGETDKDGTAKVDAEMPDEYFGECSGYLVTARQTEGGKEDLSFMLSNWNQGITSWQFNLGGAASIGPVIAHTVIDRPLFRAGETVSMKHFLRVHSGTGFAAPSPQAPTALLTHEGSGQEYEVKVWWDNGAGLSTWAIPAEAKLGNYSITLIVDADHRYPSGNFRVEQFRVPLMRAVLKPPVKPAVNARKLDIDAQLSYLSGGAAAGAPVKIRSRLVTHFFEFSDYSDFRFGGEQPKEGIEAVEPYAYDPESELDGDSDQDTPAAAENTGYPVRTQNLKLDADGGARLIFDGLPSSRMPRALEVEMEYSDPNGQILTAATRALVLPSALVLGLRIEGQYATKERMAFKVIALDTAGNIQPQHKITVEAWQRKTYAYRKRLLGGFYAYEQSAEVKRLGRVCSGSTDAHGLLSCDGPAPADGELILVAKADDAEGHAAVASTELYVAGDDNWYSASPSDRIDVLADKRAYEPGETARFEVRMPFREATALVTVEREGVLSHRVLSISAASPFVDVPILESYGPNVYVSVMVIRGRIDPQSPGRFAWLRSMFYRIGMFLGLIKEVPREVDTHPTALVDLTKPAFKLGMTQIRVGWKAYELKVKVEPEHEIYKVRDRAAFKVTVTDTAGRPALNAEIALAAVDEGLLALARPSSWDLLAAMMERRPIEVQTSTAQSQVIGKRHFGKKAAAPGGGGGTGATARELFDTLLLWKPSIRMDAQGSTRIEVPLNDSLTAFRVEAIAHAGEAQFGSGSATIRTTQEVMLFAGLPPFVREGDQFAAMLTLRNGGARPLNLEVTFKVDAGLGTKPAGSQRVALKAGEATTVSVPANVPFDATRLDWTFSAIEVGTGIDSKLGNSGGVKPAQDTLKFSQKVGAAYPVHVYQQTLEQLEANKPWAFPVQKPAGAIAGRGGLDVRLANSLGGELGSLREWMRRYPYTCLEQRTSVAIALEDKERWLEVMNSLPSYLDHDGLAKYFSLMVEGDDGLTAYLLTIADEAGYEIPEASRERMLKGLEDFVAGRIHRYGVLQTADVVMRKLAAIDALARYEHAKPEMLESLEIAPNLWPSSGVIDYLSLLSRMKEIPDREQKLTQVRQILRSRLMFSGTTMSFSTEKSDYLWWLMVSPEVNAVRALNLLANDPGFQAADAGRLARGALGRQIEGHWKTTLANAWGVVALKHFKEHYEHDPVTGKTIVQVGTDTQPLAWAQAQSHKTNDPTLGTPIGDGLDAHFNWPTQARTATPMSLEHQGGGKPWAFVASRAALPLDKPLFAGYQLKRTITPIEQHKSGVWQRGDSYRVTLEIEAQADMTWVVVNDPIPAGATILGSGLGGDSAQLASGDKAHGWATPTFEERAFDGFRAYYQYLPKGKVTVEYSVRLNNPGLFEMPATRVEALYAPEIFGELPVARIEVHAP